MSEKETIQLLKNDSHEAFSELYNIYWEQVYNFSRLYITSSEDAREVVQEVFVKLWEVRSFLKEEENFKGFLFIITRNIIFDHSKRNFNENFYKTSVLQAFNEGNIKEYYEQEDTLYATQLSELIDRLIDSMPTKQREVFLLSRKEHLSYKEISERLGISQKTVEIHISKSIKFLKNHIVLLFMFAYYLNTLR